MWPAVSLVKKRNAGQPVHRRALAAYWPMPKSMTGSFLPWTIASGTTRWAFRRASSLKTSGSHWKITPHEMGNAPAIFSGKFMRMTVGEEAALGVAADEVALDRIDLLQFVMASATSAGLSRSVPGKPL